MEKTTGIYARVSSKNIGEIKSSLYLIIKKSFIELKMRLKEMKISRQLKGSIYEVSFGFHSKLGGYATLMLDITTLYAIDFETLVRI
ncbi:MAG: hypothetical protein KAV25_09830, partial [Methanophagales archaeon]|nr:hypothetical protein [Methanophagales archaeon]